MDKVKPKESTMNSWEDHQFRAQREDKEQYAKRDLDDLVRFSQEIIRRIQELDIPPEAQHFLVLGIMYIAGAAGRWRLRAVDAVEGTYGARGF